MDDIAAFRDFNRFHTRLAGALNEHLLQSDFTLPQARVLYEIAAAADQPPAASDLAEALRVDAGYMSRLVAGLEQAGLIARAPSPGNAKRLGLTLTATGRAAFARLDQASAQEVAERLERLGPDDRRALVGAMARIRRLLGDGTCSFALRDPEPGDMGLILRGQARVYALEYGWDWTFEALVAEIIAQFVTTFDPAHEKCWVAEVDGQVAGSVFVVRQDDDTAKLRLLYVDAEARGLGLGRRLVDEALGFARAAGYRRMVLWTNDILTAARRIYETSGFTLIESEAHHSFGKDLVGQTWARDL